eukprot:g7364.t1
MQGLRRLDILKRHFTAVAKMDAPEIIHKVCNGNALLVTLNRPAKLNALTMNMIDGLNDVFNNIVLQDQVDVVLLEGAGGKAFCAGGDVARVRLSGLKQLPENEGGDGLTRNFFEQEYKLNNIIGLQQKAPQVSIWDGITMGGGVGISVHGKYRICTEKTLFAKPETAIGLFPDVGGSYFLSRLDGGLGLYIGLTGARLNAHDLIYSGIATHFVPTRRIEPLRSELLAFGTNDSVEEIIDKYSEDVAGSLGSLKGGSSLENNRSSIDRCFAQASCEDVYKALEEESTEWSKSVVKTLSPFSPMSIKQTFKLIELAHGKSLSECLQMEFDLVQHIVDDVNSDFYEGVRAVLVDKDRNAQWPEGKTIYDISEEQVLKKFEPIEKRLVFP